jgi:uncharacterized membrane protein
MNLHSVLRRAERLKILDAPAAAASRVADRAVGHGAVSDALRGSWLGHPVHPLLVTVPIGSWMTAAMFDVAFRDKVAARRLVATGLIASLPTVTAGWADFPLLQRRQQRVGLVHAVSNAVGVTLCSLSWRAYQKGREATARRYLLAGLAAVSVGGALGGHLSYAQGAGVFRWQPVQATAHAKLSEFRRAA